MYFIVKRKNKDIVLGLLFLNTPSFTMFFTSRSAFKLLQIDEEFSIFKDVVNVVDLCAAPGSWSQVCSERLKEYEYVSSSVRYSSSSLCSVENSHIVAIDLNEMLPIPGVTILQGDITSAETIEQVFTSHISTFSLISA